MTLILEVAAGVVLGSLVRWIAHETWKALVES